MFFFASLILANHLNPISESRANGNNRTRSVNSANQFKLVSTGQSFLRSSPQPPEILNDGSSYEITFSPQTDSLADFKELLMQSAHEFISARRWDQAIATYQQLVEIFPQEKLKIKKIIDILQKPPMDVKVENLGPNINSIYHDYYPIISTDGKSLYFTSRDRAGGSGGEDVWMSVRTENGWLPAINLGQPINTPDHEGFVSLAPDNNMAFLYGNYRDSRGNGDIFYTTFEKNGWSAVKNIGSSINTPDFEGDASISSDGKTLFFVSDRPGGVGEYRPRDKYYHPDYNTDIYISFKTDSVWSKPINLGSMINTPHCERGPILHPDNETLFFCSSGHPGLGDLDIFVSHKIGDYWTDWSEPENIGKDINTVNKDWGYSVHLSGEAVYFASVRDSGLGKSDIYLMKLSRKLTKSVTLVHGKLKDNEGNAIEKARIDWEDIEINKMLGVTHTQPTGDYRVLLPAGRWYRYIATKEGYIFTSRDVDLRKEDIPEKMMDIQLPKLTPAILPFPPALLNVFFNINQSTLRPESEGELDRFLKLIRDHPEWKKIEISGHTCDLGSREYNKQLSWERAQAVIDYIVDRGEPADRLVAKGYGFEQPMVYEFTEEARKKNRRVEFRVLELDLKDHH